VAREIADLLKKEISDGRFLLTEPVALFPKIKELKNLDIKL
jgi:hypothetical protein